MSVVTAPSQWFQQIQRFQHWLGGGLTLRREAGAVALSTPRTDRNEAALAAYVLAILSPLPLVGFLFGVPAVYLGIKGLRFARRYPRAGGELQCWIGVALGGVFSVVYLATAGFLLAVLRG